MAEALSNNQSGGNRRYGTYLGIVKKNTDAQNMGRCSVWIPDFGGDPEVEENWYVVSYAAPFAGSTPVKDNRKDAGDQSGSQTSYGFWMQAPDLENNVLVTFVNGDTAKGYWFACVYQQNMNHSVPGVTNNISTDQSLTDQGILPPTVEYNKKSKENPDAPKRAAFEPLHNGLSNQGLYTDAERGRSSTGARRESPSKAFGYSTPRGTQMTVDDNPENEMIRLRTRGGTQVLVHETSGYVYINSKNGNSWIEVSDEGIDIYSKKSISIRAMEDINFRADRDVNIEGERGVFVRAGQSLTTESGQNTNMKAGTDIKMGAGSAFQMKAGAALNADAGGDLTLKAGGNMLRTASQLHDNGPAAASCSTPEVKAKGDRSSTQPAVTPADAKKTSDTMATATGDATKAAGAVSTTAAAAAPAVTAAGAAATGPTAASIQTQATALAGQAQKVSDAAKTVGGQITKVQDKINSVTGQLTTAISSAQAEASKIVGTVSNTVSSATTQINKGISSATGAIGKLTGNVSTSVGSVTSLLGSASQIGGTLGASLTPKVNGIVNGAIGKATGELGSIVGQAGSVLGQVNSITGQLTSASTLTSAATAIGRVQGLAATGLGAINNARTALTNVMTEAQQVGNQLKAVGANATKVADQIKALSTSAGAAIPTEAKAVLDKAVGDLQTAATTATAAATTLTTSATSAQNKMAPEAAISTIVARMPTHEPWPWHVKEGQQSAASPQTDADKTADAIKSAAARPGMSTASGAAPTIANATETISTGTGDITRKITAKVSSLVQLGSNLVPTNVLSAVREAASVAKVDVGYLMTKASEMNFNSLSTLAGASGLMQMTQGVFGDMVNKYGAQFGVGVNDINDPRANVLMGALMTGENQTYLADKGLATGATELNLAHLMGPSVAAQFLTNMTRDANTAAYASVPEDFSRAHRSIFYAADGAAKSLADVYGVFDSRISGKANAFRSQVADVAAVTKPVVEDFPPNFFS